MTHEKEWVLINNDAVKCFGFYVRIQDNYVSYSSK